MSFNVLPFGSRPPAGSQPLAGPRAEVVDLALRRIPDHVLNEVDAAALRADDLRAHNREVRFESDPANGRVAASLHDVDGGVVRALPLREVVGYDGDGPQSAA